MHETNNKYLRDAIGTIDKDRHTKQTLHYANLYTQQASNRHTKQAIDASDTADVH